MQKKCEKTGKQSLFRYVQRVILLQPHQQSRSFRTVLLLFSLLLSFLGGVVPVAFAAPANRAQLEQAQKMLADLQPEAALQKLEKLLENGGLSYTETRDALALKGEVLALMGEEKAAILAFSILLRIDPQWQANDEHKAAISETLQKVRESLPTPEKALSYTIQPRFAGGHAGIELALLYDDMALIWTGALYSGESRFLDVPLNTNSPLGFIPVDAQTARDLILSVRLLDAAGNVLREIPLDDAAFIATLEKEDFQKTNSPTIPWMTVSGTAIAAVSLATLTATGIAFAAINPNLPGGEEGRTGLLIAAGVSTFGVIVGAGLVITDLLFEKAQKLKAEKELGVQRKTASEKPHASEDEATSKKEMP